MIFKGNLELKTIKLCHPSLENTKFPLLCNYMDVKSRGILIQSLVNSPTFRLRKLQEPV